MDTNPPIDDIPPIFDNVSIEDGAFTLKELKDAKKQLRFGKAPGEDGILPEMLKVVDINDIILNISNKFYMDNQMPDQLGIMNLLPLPVRRSQQNRKLQRYCSYLPRHENN